MQKPYYEKSNFKLYHSDSLELLAQLPENSVDMIFADPPYFLSSGSFTCQNGKMVSVKKGDWDLTNGTKDNFNFHLTWIEACRKVLKPNGSIWISGTYHSIYQCGFALQIHKYHILNDIAWLKPNASPNLSCRFFTASHETIIWARKDKKAKHTFNYKTMVEWKNNYQKEIKCKHCGKSDRYEILHRKGKQMRSVWAINTPKKIEKKFGKHPTQKPQKLLERIILASTNKGDLILDPFTGSSTTGLSAYFFDRQFIGIDNNSDYLDLSTNRFEELKENMEKNIKFYIETDYLPKEDQLNVIYVDALGNLTERDRTSIPKFTLNKAKKILFDARQKKIDCYISYQDKEGDYQQLDI